MTIVTNPFRRHRLRRGDHTSSTARRDPLVLAAVAGLCAVTALIYIFLGSSNDGISLTKRCRDDEDGKPVPPPIIWTAAAEVEAGWGGGGGILRVRTFRVR